MNMWKHELPTQIFPRKLQCGLPEMYQCPSGYYKFKAEIWYIQGSMPVQDESGSLKSHGPPCNVYGVCIVLSSKIKWYYQVSYNTSIWKFSAPSIRNINIFCYVNLGSKKQNGAVLYRLVFQGKLGDGNILPFNMIFKTLFLCVKFGILLPAIWAILM